jgi:hypothetical protein
LKIICHVLVQLTILSRSCWSRLQSSLVGIAKYSRLSSANRRILDVMSLPISLIYKRNIKVPSTVPCGTPDVTLAVLDLSPSMLFSLREPCFKP